MWEVGGELVCLSARGCWLGGKDHNVNVALSRNSFKGKDFFKVAESENSYRMAGKISLIRTIT